MLTQPDLSESLHLLDTYIRIPTISSEIDQTTLEAVLIFWQAQGLNFEKLYPPGPIKGPVSNPVLFGELKADYTQAPTLLLYGHWDVQPTGELSEWVWREQVCPPFEPTYFVNDKFLATQPDAVLDQLEPAQLPAVLLVGRGSADNKGQHLANILGVLRTKAAGKLRWNIKILLDGEEEIGSPNLPAIVESHREKLQADFMVGSDGPKSDNRPTMLLGVRGLLGLKLQADNGSGRMLHSGNYGNIVPNPVLPVARLLEQMGQTVKAMGLASEDFRAEVNRFFDRQHPDYAHFEPFLYPTFNVNSLMSQGVTGGQRRTIIPGWVTASIDVRLTPDLPPELVFKTLEALVEKANREEAGVTFKLEMGSATASSYTAPDREGYRWLREAMGRFWGSEVRVIPLLGGTLPNDVFTAGLNMASYWLPAANSNNRQHDACEHFVLEHFYRQQEFYAELVATPYR